MKRLDRKSVFGSPRRAVFLKNTCSGLPEVLFFSKTVEIPPVSRVFFQRRMFQPLGRVTFLKNGCSNPLDGLFFSKTDVPTPWTSYFSQKRLFQPLGRA